MAKTCDNKIKDKTMGFSDLGSTILRNNRRLRESIKFKYFRDEYPGKDLKADGNIYELEKRDYSIANRKKRNTILWTWVVILSISILGVYLFYIYLYPLLFSK